MKKIVKMSLVAAVAVAGLTTANAKPLEEAIKNVDVSGTVVYRYDDRDYNDYQDDNDSTNDGDLSKNNYKIGLNLKAKVNDDVTAVTRFIVGSQTDAGFVGLDTTSADDGQADVSLSNVYFSYTGIANTTINVGKQGLTTPWTVAQDSDGNEQNGTGILALTTVGPVTLAGAYFNQNNLDASGDLSGTLSGIGANGIGDNNIWTAAVIGNVGPVALDAWYLDLDEVFDTYTIGAMAKFDFDAVKLSVGARHTEVEFDDDYTIAGVLDGKDNSLTKIMLGLKAGIFGANVNYGWTDSEGGIGALDNDATTGMQGYTVQLNGVADAEYLQVSVDAQVLESLNIALKYHQLDKDKNDDLSRGKDLTDYELYLQATYKMSPNLSTYVRFGENEYEQETGDDKEGTIGRLQVQYSF